MVFLQKQHTSACSLCNEVWWLLQFMFTSSPKVSMMARRRIHWGKLLDFGSAFSSLPNVICFSNCALSNRRTRRLLPAHACTLLQTSIFVVSWPEAGQSMTQSADASYSSFRDFLKVLKPCSCFGLCLGFENVCCWGT